MRYLTYRPMMDGLERVAKRFEDPLAEAIKVCSGLHSIEGLVMLDEMTWRENAGRIYFLETERLVQCLYRAKIRLCGGTLKAPVPAFAVAVPEKLKIDGLEIGPFVVSWSDEAERKGITRKMSKRAGIPIDYVGDPRFPDSWRLSVVSREGYGYSASCIPQTLLARALEVPISEFASVIGDMGEMAHVTLSGDESRRQAVQVRLACALMAYLEALPSATVDGMPGSVKRRDIEGRATMRISTMTVREPEGMRLERGGACTHYRSWYFRRYPLRDGKRRDGMVFVSDTVVNAWAGLEPKTVMAT